MTTVLYNEEDKRYIASFMVANFVEKEHIICHFNLCDFVIIYPIYYIITYSQNKICNCDSFIL
jgi:hypothetical protein